MDSSLPLISSSGNTWASREGGQTVTPPRSTWPGIPALPSGARQSDAPRNPASPDGKSEAPLVMVVDDDHVLGELIAELLYDEGYRVVLATDGKAALAQARRSQPALVITDCMMPGMGGMELVRELRRGASTRAIPVVLMSSAPPPAQLVGVPFLPKPFSVDEVLELVAYYVVARPRAQLYGEG